MTISSDTRFWDRAARKYAKGAIADQAGYERTLGRTLALLNAGDRVLELGCGTGTTALRLAGKVHDYLATDVSAEMIAIARERYGAEPMPSLSFRRCARSARRPMPVSFGYRNWPSRYPPRASTSSPPKTTPAKATTIDPISWPARGDDIAMPAYSSSFD